MGGGKNCEVEKELLAVIEFTDSNPSPEEFLLFATSSTSVAIHPTMFNSQHNPGEVEVLPNMAAIDPGLADD